MTMLNDVLPSIILAGAQFTTRALSSSTANAGELTGSPLCIMINTGGTPGTYTTRSAALMIADGNLQQGQSWMIFLANNQGTGTLTLGAGSGVSAGGTLTVGTNVARWFLAQVTGAAAVTITGLALSHICAV